MWSIRMSRVLFPTHTRTADISDNKLRKKKNAIPKKMQVIQKMDIETCICWKRKVREQWRILKYVFTGLFSIDAFGLEQSKRIRRERKTCFNVSKNIQRWPLSLRSEGTILTLVHIHWKTKSSHSYLRFTVWCLFNVRYVYMSIRLIRDNFSTAVCFVIFCCIWYT